MEQVDIWIYVLMFGVALFAGFVDSIVGGGGLITIPALLAVGIPEHVALATNKLQANFGSFTAALRFVRGGYIDFKRIWLGIVCTFVGAALGTWSVLLIDATVIRWLVPLLLVAIFLYTIFCPDLGKTERAKKMSEGAFYAIFGIAIGFYDGFLGPGTGSFWMFAMLALIGLEIKQAIANTKVLNSASNILSLVVFIMGGHILWTLGLVMGAGQAIGAYLGASTAMKKEIGFIRRLFLAVVAATILKLFYDLLFK